jgi:hypothetical protein
VITKKEVLIKPTEQEIKDAELKAKFAEQDARINKERAEEKARLEATKTSNSLNDMLSQYNSTIQKQIDEASALQQKQEAERYALENSTQCISAKNKISEKNNQLSVVKARLDQITTMTQEKGDLLIQSALLSTEIGSLTNEKYMACLGYIPGEIPKTYNTSCYYLGYTLHCNTQ